MIKQPSALGTARVALQEAEEGLADPGRLGHFRNAINLLVRVMSGVSPQIEKDIAKKLVLTCRNNVLSAVKVFLANSDSYEAKSLEHWNNVMEVFVDAGLGDDPEFNTWKERLVTQRGSQSIGNLQSAHVDILDEELRAALDKELQAALDSLAAHRSRLSNIKSGIRK
jgi:hypothetical protein